MTFQVKKVEDPDTTGFTEEEMSFWNIYFSPDTPTSITVKAPLALSNLIKKNALECREYWHLVNNEDLLLETFYKEKRFYPNMTEQRLRIAFWQEYENAILGNKLMEPHKVHSLVCSMTSFYSIMSKSNYRILYMLSKPLAYEVCVKETLLHGLKRVREILDMDHYNKKGEINTKMLELKLRVTAMMDMRLNGAPTQKIQQLNLNINQDAPKNLPNEPSVQELVKKGDMHSIRERLQKIEHEKKRLEGRITGKDPQILEAELVEKK